MKRVLVWQSILVLCAIASALVALTPVRAAEPDTAAPRVRVISCQVMSGMFLPRQDDVGLVVRFQNDSATTFSSIVWRAKYGKLTADFIDDGEFAPSIQIDNFLLTEEGRSWVNGWKVAAALIGAHSGNGSVFSSSMVLPDYISTEEPENCAIVRTTDASGRMWLNPALPQSFASVPAPVRPASPAPAASRSVPVDITHCSFSYYGAHLSLQTTLVNQADRVADRIVVRTAYSSGHVDFVDQATFAPATIVVHRLKRSGPPDWKRRSYSSLDDPSDCAVRSVHYVDGTTWDNPLLPPEPGPLPTPVPNAIAGIIPVHWARHTAPVESPAPSPFPSP
jgi:hypothetical protein